MFTFTFCIIWLLTFLLLKLDGYKCIKDIYTVYVLSFSYYYVCICNFAIPLIALYIYPYPNPDPDPEPEPVLWTRPSPSPRTRTSLLDLVPVLRIPGPRPGPSPPNLPLRLMEYIMVCFAPNGVCLRSSQVDLPACVRYYVGSGRLWLKIHPTTGRGKNSSYCVCSELPTLKRKAWSNIIPSVAC